jgi:hypothetical protein
MAANTQAAQSAFSTTESLPPAMQGIEQPDDPGPRLRRIRRRLVLEGTLRAVLLALLWLTMTGWAAAGPATFRARATIVLVVFAILPGIAMKWWNWAEAKRAVSDMWAFGALNFHQISTLLTARKTIQAEIRSGRKYVDVVHGQISDALAEAERARLSDCWKRSGKAGREPEAQRQAGRTGW